MHKLRSCDKSVHEKVWEREKHRGMELGSKTVGIIGYGVMGKAFATKLRGIGCTIIAYDKYTSGFSDEYVTEVTEEEFFRRSEIVSVHLPFTDETNGLIDSAWLARFSHPFIFVNSSRGAVVKTKDLLDALDANQVTAIALDVLEFEGRSLEGLTSMGTTDAQKTLSPKNIVATSRISKCILESSCRWMDHRELLQTKSFLGRKNTERLLCLTTCFILRCLFVHDWSQNKEPSVP